MNNTKQRVLFAKGKSNNLTEREGLPEEAAAARTLVRYGSARTQKSDQILETKLPAKELGTNHYEFGSPQGYFSNKPRIARLKKPAGTAAPAGNSM